MIKQSENDKKAKKLIEKDNNFVLGILLIVLLLLFFYKIIPSTEIGIIRINAFVAGLIIVSAIALLVKIFRHQTYGFGIVDFAIICLSGFFFISMFRAPTLIESGYLSFHALFIPILLYYNLKALIQTERAYNLVLRTLFLGFLVLAISSIFIFLTTFSRPSPLNIHAIGAACLLFVGFFVFFLLPNKGFFSYIIGFPIILLGLLSLLPRAYLVFLLITPLFFKLARKGRLFVTAIIFFFVTLLLTITIAQSPTIVKPNSIVKQKEGGSIDRIVDEHYWRYALYGRAYSYQEGLRNFLKYKIAGTGLEMGDQGESITIHNFHIEWLQYGGVLGYVAYLFVFLSYFWSIRKYAKVDKHIAFYSICVLGILGNSVTNGLMHGLMPHTVFLVMGLTAARLKVFTNCNP